MVLMFQKAFILFFLRRVRQRDAAENLVQPAFLGVQFLDLPRTGGGEDVARKVSVAFVRGGIDARPDLSPLLFEYGRLARAGNLRETFRELRASDASGDDQHRTAI